VFIDSNARLASSMFLILFSSFVFMLFTMFNTMYHHMMIVSCNIHIFNLYVVHDMLFVICHVVLIYTLYHMHVCMSTCNMLISLVILHIKSKMQIYSIAKLYTRES
jgi:hypothetical protein